MWNQRHVSLERQKSSKSVKTIFDFSQQCSRRAKTNKNRRKGSRKFCHLLTMNLRSTNFPAPLGRLRCKYGWLSVLGELVQVPGPQIMEDARQCNLHVNTVFTRGLSPGWGWCTWSLRDVSLLLQMLLTLRPLASLIKNQALSDA